MKQCLLHKYVHVHVHVYEKNATCTCSYTCAKLHTVEPPNKGDFGNNINYIVNYCLVFCREVHVHVVLFSEVPNVSKTIGGFTVHIRMKVLYTCRISRKHYMYKHKEIANKNNDII